MLPENHFPEPEKLADKYQSQTVPAQPNLQGRQIKTVVMFGVSKCFLK
jgi:hypothetical protein